MTDQQDPSAQIRRKRSIVMALVLGAFVVLVYAISITRMGMR